MKAGLMLTFSLGGKDCAVDIDTVKEVVQLTKCARVPNSAAYVAGVCNLRGEILSVVDLRIMLGLPARKKPGAESEVALVLRREDRMIAALVDSIGCVVRISSGRVRRPHRELGDIAIRYLSGVVEHHGRLHIVPDLERILERRARHLAVEAPGGPEGDQIAGRERDSSAEKYESHEAFYSRDTGRLWSRETADAFCELLPERLRNTITVWNPGAGMGFESYSLACLLRTAYPGAMLTIWACDIDLFGISTAPNLVFRPEEVPALYREYLVEGRNGYSFTGMIKDALLFEYHDLTQPNTVPDMDLIVARDVLSYLPPEEQISVLQEFYRKLLDHGILILGDRETGLVTDRWERIEESRISAFRKKPRGVIGRSRRIRRERNAVWSGEPGRVGYATDQGGV